jgi:hypothetical protein
VAIGLPMVATLFTSGGWRATISVMSGDVQLMLMIAGMHLVGLVCAATLLLPALRGGPDLPPRSDRGSDDGWGHGPPRPPTPHDAPPGGLPLPLPLPDAAPARVRLRDHRRLPDLVPRPERRPAREPARDPVRTGR